MKYFRAGGITFQVQSDFTFGDQTFHPKFKRFEVGGPGCDNLIIYHHFHSPNDRVHPEKEVYKNDQWQIFKNPDHWIYKYRPLPPYSDKWITGIFSLDHTRVDIYASHISKRDYKNLNLGSLTLFNTDQVLFSKLLCDRNGMILHGNGFDICGNGIILTGKSGAGKSTLSEMLKKQGHKILCDDRIFITFEDNTPIVCGSWCHGTVPDVSPGSARLSAILFLEHSKKNSIELITNKEIILRNFFPSIVKPLFGAEDWNKTLSTFERTLKTTDFYRVQFDLSGQICNKINNLIKTNKDS